MARSRCVALVLACAFGTGACTGSTPPPVPSSVISPAPRVDCPFGIAREVGRSVDPSSLMRVMHGHVPRWLPEGMGLFQAFGSSTALRGAAWFADDRCREVQVWLWRSTGRVSGSDRTGPWAVDESGPRACANFVLGEARCIEYRANVEGGQIGVQMMGIDRAVGDRIVRSIPTSSDSEPPYALGEGIFEPAEDILPAWDFVNYWVGRVRDRRVSVYAGSQDSDPNQGGVVVVPYGAPPGHFLQTPLRAGSVKIVSAPGTTLTLVATDRTTFVFDVESESYSYRRGSARRLVSRDGHRRQSPYARFGSRRRVAAPLWAKYFRVSDGTVLPPDNIAGEIWLMLIEP